MDSVGAEKDHSPERSIIHSGGTKFVREPKSCGLALKGREVKMSVAILADKKTHEAVAKTAVPVKENDRRKGGFGCHSPQFRCKGEGMPLNSWRNRVAPETILVCAAYVNKYNPLERMDRCLLCEGDGHAEP